MVARDGSSAFPALQAAAGIAAVAHPISFQNRGAAVKHVCLLLSLLVGLLIGATAWAGDTVTIVNGGKAASVILLPSPAQADEPLAAKELTDHLKKMTGAEVAVQSVAADKLAGALADIRGKGLVPIVIGSLALTPENKDAILKQGSDPASFILKKEPDGIYLAGLSAEGTLFAAYEMLEQMGVRWFMPGDIGTVIPQTTSTGPGLGVTIQVPTFHGRHTGGEAAWTRRMRHGGPYFPGSHGINLGPTASFAKHPEYFALIHGKRVEAQLCVSNPDVVKLAVQQVKAYFKQYPKEEWIGMGPNDGSGFCECANCQALDAGDWDPFSNERSVTDRYIWFFNQVLDGIKDEYPGKKVCFYSYHVYMRPPQKIKPNPLIVPALAPIALCRIHSMNNPICPEKSYVQSLIAGCEKVLPELYDRGYWFNLADPGFPFMMISRLREDIPLEKKLGIAGLRVESINHWGSESPSLYIASKLMWNANADVDALMQDYTDKFFGPASKPMLQYLTLLDSALHDSDYHTGCSFDLPHIYTPAVRAQGQKLLKRAAILAGNTIYGQRVQIYQETFDYLKEFIAMLDHQNEFDFVKAQDDLNQVTVSIKRLTGYNPSMINPNAASAYLHRFFSQTTEQGFKRTTGGNELAAAFNDEWDFMLDPAKTGEDIGLWRKETTGGNWQQLKTFSQSWSDQGLRMYKGYAWYRQAVKIPKRFAGKRLFLWFGGVDEKAKVWVNGKLVGISHEAAMLPFEFDATDAMIPGEKNTVAVLIKNETLDELGTGGILSPVMFYAPVAGKEAKLENVYPLATAFP